MDPFTVHAFLHPPPQPLPFDTPANARWYENHLVLGFHEKIQKVQLVDERFALGYCFLIPSHRLIVRVSADNQSRIFCERGFTLHWQYPVMGRHHTSLLTVLWSHPVAEQVVSVRVSRFAVYVLSPPRNSELEVLLPQSGTAASFIGLARSTTIHD